MSVDLRAVLGDIDLHLTEIRHDLQAALASMAGQATTGYATTTRPGPGVTTPGQGDPVLTTISNARPGRHVTQHHPDRHELDHAIRDAERLLARARGLIHKHTPPAEATPDQGEPGCTSCARIGQYMPRGKGTGDLCLWCWKHRGWHHAKDHGPEMPARSIVAAYHANGRVTTKDAIAAGIPITTPSPP